MTRHNTIQRSLVLDAVNGLKSHATADEVYAEVAATHPNISKTTVYRNLNLLSEMGMIRKLEIPGGADRFDHICKEHCHVKCEKCGRFYDLPQCSPPPTSALLKKPFDGEIHNYSLIFFGVCTNCCMHAEQNKKEKN